MNRRLNGILVSQAAAVPTAPQAGLLLQAVLETLGFASQLG